MKSPLVSVIIPSYNSAQFVRSCLQSVVGQSYKNIEIIVVDRNSTDKTVETAKKFTDKVYSFGPERAAQVNFGGGLAKGKYLYRVDSDFVLEKDVIRECVEKAELENLDGIAVHNTSAEGLGFWADVRKFERNTYRDDNLIVAVRFFTKESWQKIGGFDEKLYGPEDYDFHNRFVKKGFKWGRIKSIERHLGEPKSLLDIWQKHFFYGKQMLYYFQKDPRIAMLQFNPIRSGYIRHLGTFFTHPMLSIGLLIMTIVKFLAGGLGFLFATLANHTSQKMMSHDYIAKRLYGGFGWVSIFTKIRFWTGSYIQLETLIPKKGRILDLGCGYGIFTNYLAVCSKKRIMIGIDIDTNKINHADKGLKNVKFFLGDATKMKLKNLDAILIHDVLHHLGSYKEQEKLIKDCANMLKKEGTLFVVEVDNSPLWKLILGRLSDFVIYKGQSVYYKYKKDMVKLLGNYFPPKNINIEILSNSPFSQVVYICQKN